MQKLILYFVALFVLFFACTQDQSTKTSASTQQSATSTTQHTSTPAPTPPSSVPPNNAPKAVPQAAAKDLKYPKAFKDMGVNQFKGAKVTNNNLLENSQGKYGQRINLSFTGNYEEVMKFYATNLEQNGWTKNAKMDKSGGDEDITFFSTNYIKDNYTLMHSVTKIQADQIKVLQILKEN